MKLTMATAVCALLIPLVPVAGSEETTSVAYGVMELEGKAPDWWTPEAALAAKAAAAEGLLYNPLTGETVAPTAVPVGVPAGAPDYLFIRPGALYLSESGVLCTYNFIYSAFRQIGTAGHCPESRGETVYILAVPTIPLVTALGTVGSFRNGGVGNDWALINIDPAWDLFVDANVAYVGGPSCAAWSPGVEAGKHVGHGIQTGLIASVPRTSAILAFDGRSFQGVGEISGGDSGSPMVEVAGALPGCATGGAVGVMTHCATITGIECLPLFFGTDIRRVPATVTLGLDPI
ncbi:MAG: hypothetical protein HYT80_04475 [Euryarchaeota archaeon]|nr:hypothetical protein [Euryarchaeota archaeon]